MADSEALRARRSRGHRAGDHSLCDPGRCAAAGGRGLVAVPDGARAAADEVDTAAALLAAVASEFDAADRTVRALGLRLAVLAGGQGPAAVSAARALGELVAVQRAPGQVWRTASAGRRRA